MQPWATGMRSPAGHGMVDGEFFYTDNQGDWQGSGGVIHVKKGVFTGHPAGLRWTGMANSPLKLTADQLFTVVSNRENKNENGRYIKPENVVNETPDILFQVKEKFPEIQTPAVWLPHGVLGISNSQILNIPQGAFGPFGGQLLVGDQGMSMISRVMLEKVNGEYQGASIMFRSGFRSGVMRMAFAPDGSLFVGETNRGWGSAGDANEGLQRLVYSNEMPFEMQTVRATPDGFDVEFTKPIAKASAEDLAAYSVESFIYKYQPVYGSPTINKEKHAIKGVKLSDDGMHARIVVDNLRKNYIHQLTLDGLRSQDGSYSLVHPIAYYTLNNIPEGPKLAMAELSTKNSATAKTTAPVATPTTGKTPATKAGAKGKATKQPALQLGQAVSLAKAPSYDEVKGLLSRHTCLACHNTEKKQVGPAYREVAKRGYTNDQIVDLIYNPKPANWPDYAVEMPPMPQVPKADALKIAAWINSMSPGNKSNAGTLASPDGPKTK